MSNVVLLYVTVPDHHVANSIGHELVEDRLAACVNILGDIRSIFRWEGKVTKDDEVAMLVKTTETKAKLAIERIHALHPYECPAILTLAVSGGFAQFLAWVGEETKA